MMHIPLCVVNIDDYYAGTIAQLSRANEEGLLYDSPEDYFHVETDVLSALNWCLAESDKLKAPVEAPVGSDSAMPPSSASGGDPQACASKDTSLVS